MISPSKAGTISLKAMGKTQAQKETPSISISYKHFGFESTCIIKFIIVSFEQGFHMS